MKDQSLSTSTNTIESTSISEPIQTDKQTSNAIYFLFGSLIGLALYILLYGVSRLDVSNTNYIFSRCNDIVNHYLGWCFFRNGDWQFPIGLTDQMYYPNSISVLFADSIPIFAIFFKLFRSILPETFQYIGLYGLLCFVLQGGMGSLITRRFTSSKFICILCSIIFTLTPVMLFRVYWHTALASHFLILYALYLWLCAKDLTWEKAIIHWNILAFLCGGIHLYFFPMIGIILIAFCIRIRLEKNCPIWKCLLLIINFCLTGAFTVWIIGGFYGGMGLSSVGFGYFNSNLNTLINNIGTGKLLPNLSLGTGGQYEGYGYLGAGVLFLLVISLVLGIINRKELFSMIKENKAILISSLWIMIIALIIAVGNTICLNSHTLLSFELPDKLLNILNMFRASGRFIWLIDYVLTIYAVKLTCVLIKQQKLQLLAFLCSCILLMIDMSGYYYNFQDEPFDMKWTSAKYENLAKQFDSIHILGYLDNLELYYVANFAATHNLSITQFAASRVQDSMVTRYIVADNEVLKQNKADSSVLYIFDNTFYSTDYNLHLYNLDGIIVGSSNPIDGFEEEQFSLNTNKYFFAGNSAAVLTISADQTNFDENQTYSQVVGVIYPASILSITSMDFLSNGDYTISLTGYNIDMLSFSLINQSTGEDIPISVTTNENQQILQFYLSCDNPDLTLSIRNNSTDNNALVVNMDYIKLD
ncbi:MAG: hypothetical protein J6B50_12585 [Lachnospiraceae bacterium]|nr:hypothetical protein [Lachnospiraceae bacterium]